MIRVVFVCTGNICRSPMAEGILRKEWEMHNRPKLIVSSMGTSGFENQKAAEFSEEVCRENGVDISSHISRGINVPELESADIILSMEWGHKKFLQLFIPQIDDKSSTLGLWPDEPTRKNIAKSNVKDPYGSHIKKYREVYQIISGHIKRIIPVVEEFFCYRQR